MVFRFSVLDHGAFVLVIFLTVAEGWTSDTSTYFDVHIDSRSFYCFTYSASEVLLLSFVSYHIGLLGCSCT